MAGLGFAGGGQVPPEDGRRPRSLAETAYDAIEQMIISRRLAPGAMVSEGELGAELGLGRTPVREALARLKTIGFVEVHPRRGVLVTQVDVIKHLELLEVRRPLDETVARCVIARGTAEDMARLLDRAAGLRSAAEARDREAYFRTKRGLHEALVGAAYNATLTGLRPSCACTASALRSATTGPRSPQEQLAHNTIPPLVNKNAGPSKGRHQTLAHMLGEAGYTTGLVGLWAMGRPTSPASVLEEEAAVLEAKGAPSKRSLREATH